MSRLAVREAIASFLAEAGVEYVGIVYEARPEIINEQDYEANRMGEAVSSASGSSAVLVVNKAAVEIFFASTAGNAVKAQEDYDVIVDGIVNGIRADATLGAPGTVWSAGEYDDGVDHVQGEPYTDADGMTVFIPGVVHFEAWEWIAGNV